jgi:hypothetical protein
MLDTGTPTLSAGDVEMLTRILAAGYRITYDPAALNWHCHRRTHRAVRHTLYSYGVGVYAAWTRRLLAEGDLNTFRTAFGWFRYWQLPAMAASLLRRPDSVPLDLILAQLWGCLLGPWIYLRARRQARTEGGERDVR